MMLVHSHTHTQSLDVIGGATLSIFRQAESWLLAHADHQRALEYVARRKNMEKYHSMMDFLFCEVFVKYQKDCFRYYEGKGPLLKEMISQEQIDRYDTVLLEALKIAYQAFCEQRKVSWGWFQAEALKLAA